MFKKLYAIAVNRMKLQAFDLVLETLIAILTEFRRANNDGEYDMHRQRDQVLNEEDFDPKSTRTNDNLKKHFNHDI